MLEVFKSDITWSIMALNQLHMMYTKKTARYLEEHKLAVSLVSTFVDLKILSCYTPIYYLVVLNRGVNAKDPPSVTEVRAKEAEIIADWIAQHKLKTGNF